MATIRNGPRKAPPQMATPARPLSIVHVVDSLEFGGLERVVTDLAVSQLQHGHRVSVFSINDTKGFAPELRSCGIDVHVGHKQGTLDLAVLKALRRVASQQSADIVHGHNFVPNYYAALAMLGMWRRPCLVNTCHDMGARLSNRKLRLLFQFSLLKTARVAMVGAQVHERYVSSGMVRASRAETVLNGIPVDRFQITAPRRLAAREKLGIDNDAFVLGCVGRLVGLKNHALLIDLLPDLLRIQPRLKLVIVGYGELHAALNQQAASLGVSDHVVITGQRSDVADLLPGFDVFALPSLTEGLSIALLEACASGLPILASAVGGNPEIVHHNSTGLLVPAADPVATAAAIRMLINDEELRTRLGQSAQEWVRANASTDVLEQAYDKFYRQAMRP
jgi:glycosyltransferase involved in cell wall biosynthesis